MSTHIKVEGISLRVPMYVQPSRLVRGWAGMLFGAAFDPPRRQFTQLLADISFTAREGDRIAILGRNGAGKSTLLRVLNGVYAPTSGQLQVSGSCQALLNISLGFNGEATVRENIFLRGTAMGLRAAALRDQLDPILDFAGLQEKSSHRLRTLSSGQRVRLGFAISTSFQHDIMLMDEWLGAGDSQFMTKAKERMISRVGGSKIVMLASHSVGLLRELCNKGLVLEQGKLLYSGNILEALRCYHELMAQLREDPQEAQAADLAAPRPVAYGYVETMVLDAGLLRLRGWFVDTEGGSPSVLGIRVHDNLQLAIGFRRLRRPDVMRHLGLSDDLCGFEAEFPVSGIDSCQMLGADFSVVGGDAHHPDAPLKLAGPVYAMVLGPDQRQASPLGAARSQDS